MSTLFMQASRAVKPNALSARPFRKPEPPRPYFWPSPWSKRQLAGRFAVQVLPGLERLLGGVFRDYPELEREEAVQDCVCQAWEVYRTAGGRGKVFSLSHSAQLPVALADYASRRYLSGLRFAGAAGQPAGL